MGSEHTPRRIVSLQPSATVILQAIGELDRVVACTRYCRDVCPDVGTGCTIIADSWSAKTAEIVGARPDLVIAAVPYQEKALAEILKAGARFLGLAPKTLSDIYTDITTIAGALGVRERGERVVGHMQQAIERMRVETAALGRPRVFCEEWGKPLIASQPWVAELVEAAGGECVGTPGMRLTTENVREDDPDVLIAAWCGAGDRVPLEKIVRDRGWANTRAAKQGRVYCIRDELLNTPAPTLLAGLRALAAAIHPERFESAVGLRRILKVSTESEVSDATAV